MQLTKMQKTFQKPPQKRFKLSLGQLTVFKAAAPENRMQTTVECGVDSHHRRQDHLNAVNTTMAEEEEEEQEGEEEEEPVAFVTVED